MSGTLHVACTGIYCNNSVSLGYTVMNFVVETLSPGHGYMVASEAE